jgi:hypothetical protein
MSPYLIGSADAMTEEFRTWLWDTMTSMREEMTAQHGRLRSDISAGADRLRQEIREVSDKVDTLSKAVVRIEAQRELEEKQSVRRGAWAGILAAAGLTALLEGFKAWFHRN